MRWDTKLKKIHSTVEDDGRCGNPVLVELVPPVRQYMTGAGGTWVQTTARMTADGYLNTPMVDDIDYQTVMTVYLSKKKRYDNQE